MDEQLEFFTEVELMKLENDQIINLDHGLGLSCSTFENNQIFCCAHQQYFGDYILERVKKISGVDTLAEVSEHSECPVNPLHIHYLIT